MENHIWKHNAKLPITIYEEHWYLSCTVLSLMYSNIKKGACQFATITLFLAPHKKHQSKAHLKERKEEIRSEIDFSLFFSVRLDNWGFASVRAFVECL